MAMTQDNYKGHISQQFDEDLEGLRSRFMQMGGLVEQQVTDAIHALLDMDMALAMQVEQQDRQVNLLETQIDEAISRLLARRQPAASDLRLVLAISKSNTDLERIGDEAVKIARVAQSITEEGESPRGYTETRHIGSQVRLMLRDALDAFARLDIQQSLNVIQADTDVDREYQTAMRSIMTYLIEDARYISRVIGVMWVLRALERIGDHARNIGEQTIYAVKGADVRHRHPDSIEQTVNPHEADR